VGDGEVAEQTWSSGEPEACEVASLDFLGDGVAGEEGHAEALACRALGRLARAELPDAGRLDPDRLQLVIDDALRARPGLAGEEHELGQPRGRELAVFQRREPRLGDADDFVLEEGVELDALVGAGGADERELDAAVQESLEDLLTRCDLDVDGDAGVGAAEAAECVREQVDAGCGRSAEVDRARLQSGERTELLVCRAEAGECLRGPCGEDVACLRQLAAAAAALDEALPGCGLEQAQVLARARLADPDRSGGGGHAPLALDLDEQAHPRRVPELAQRARLSHLRYR